MFCFNSKNKSFLCKTKNKMLSTILYIFLHCLKVGFLFQTKMNKTKTLFRLPDLFLQVAL